MKKFLVSLVMLVVTTLGAHAQFEKDVWYVNASLTGLDLSHSKYEGTNFGFTLGGGAFVADNFAVLKPLPRSGREPAFKIPLSRPA